MKKLLLLISGAVLACTVSIAQPVGWSFVQPITVTNNTGTATTNLQVRVTVDTQTPIGLNNMLASGNDIRFGKNCAGTTLFNYWIESGLNTTTTQIWVKLDSLNANESRTFYMYYGNAVAPAASAVIGTFVGPHSSTDSVASGGAGGATNSQRGFRFAPNQDILLYAFGKRDPNGTTRYVTLFNFATQAILLQGQVSGPAAQYNYNPVANPMWLIQGTQYVLELYQGASDGYYFGTSSQIGQHLTYLDMRYCNSCTQNTFPTNTLSNYHYGYPDFWYFTKNSLSTNPTVTPGSTLTANIASVSPLCLGDSVTLNGFATGGGGSYTYLWFPPSGLSNVNIGNPVASPTTTTTYSFTATDACGATNSATVQVVVNPVPVVGLTGNSSFCSGDSTMLTGSNGGGTFQWYMNGVVIPGATSNTYNATQPGVYNMTETISGCGDSAATGLTVSLYAPPVVTASVTNDSICPGSSVTFNGGGANTYVWSGGVTDGVPFAPVSSGTYTVTGTDTNTGCSATATVNVDVLALPNVTATASSNPVCAGSPVTLSGGGAMSYSWDNSVTDGVPFNATATTTYIVTGTDMYGCQDTASVQVVVNALPTVVPNASASAVCSGSPLTLTGSGATSYTWDNSVTDGVAFNPTATTTYMVTGTDANGCQNTATITVTVNPNPVVNFGDDISACAGSVTLNAQNSGSTYLWNNNSTGQTLTVTTSGTYWVAVTDGNGCTGTDTVNVAINTPPVATLTASDNSVCIDDANVTLTTAPAGGILNGSGVTGNQFDPTVAGIGTQLITYIYTDVNGCSDTTTTAIVVSACVGITEQVSGIAAVYPNPASDLVNITWTKTATTRIKAYDISGKLVYDQMHNGVTRAQVNVNNWPAGTYTFRIEQGSGFETILVEKR